MKKLSGMEAALRAARRVADPMTGEILESPPNFDPHLLPHVDWPVSPMVERAISIAISEAMDTSLSLRDAFERVRTTLAAYGIDLKSDDIEALITQRRGR
ncbi:MAG: hypothetical protein DCC58_06685 [Chloroflexi bacterium]|nr:MAG: hypothetical protein DCC58_06685 [Chloroflexota bacterium]